MLADQYTPDDLPIPDELFADVISPDQTHLFALIAKLSPAKRALLAMYCYRRSHLSEIGLAIAATCDEDDLSFTCGRAGADLFSKSRRAPAGCGKSRTSDIPPQNYAFHRASARNARARLNIGVDLASFQKKKDVGSMLDAAATAVMIAGVLVGVYAFYGYWTTG